MCNPSFPNTPARSLSAKVLGLAVVLACFAGDASAQGYRMSVGCPNAPTRKIDAMTRDITLAEWKQTLARECGMAPEPRPGVPPYATGTTPPAPNPRRFTIIDAGDLNGGDLGDPVKRVNYTQCVSLCEGNSECVGFAFDRFNSFCFLKSSLVGDIRYDPSSTLGVLSTKRVSPSLAPRVIEVFRNAVFYDKSYRNPQMSSFDDCKSECARDEDCEVFSFMKETKVCRLIKKPLEYCRKEPKIPTSYCASRQYLSADSGVKRQLD